MRRPSVPIGATFSQLTLQSYSDQRLRKNVLGIWRCTCGSQKAIPLARVASGNAKSCGCRKWKHGFCSATSNKSQEYVAWLAMRARCAAKSGRDFDSYGARGIAVCPRWNEFATFLADMGKKPSKKHSLGRIDNNLGYSPSNCRWETPAQQMQNTRKSRRWHIYGEEFPSCREAARRFSVDHKTIRYWIKTGKGDCYVH